MEASQKTPPSAAPMHSRPDGVPRLWQGPSPFEYRGLETESFEETPRGTPSAAPEQAQLNPERCTTPQVSSKSPPLLKRNLGDAAKPQQSQQTVEVAQPEKVGPADVHSTEARVALLINLRISRSPFCPTEQYSEDQVMFRITAIAV